MTKRQGLRQLHLAVGYGGGVRANGSQIQSGWMVKGRDNPDGCKREESSLQPIGLKDTRTGWWASIG